MDRLRRRTWGSRRRQRKESKAEDSLIPGYSRKPAVQYLETSEQRRLDQKRKIEEIKLKRKMHEKALAEYEKLGKDISGEQLLKAMSARDPDVVRYVRLEEKEDSDSRPKYLLGEETVYDESRNAELSYIRTKISEDKPEEEIEEEVDELEEELEEIEEAEEEEEEEEVEEDEYEEEDALEYVRTNISSQTEVTSREVKDILAERDAYYTDIIKDKRTSISDFKVKNTLREEYLMVGRTSISSKKYVFTRISQNSAPVYQKKDHRTYRLLLKGDKSLE